MNDFSGFHFDLLPVSMYVSELVWLKKRLIERVFKTTVMMGLFRRTPTAQVGDHKTNTT